MRRRIFVSGAFVLSLALGHTVSKIRGQVEERRSLCWVPGGCVLNQLVIGKAPTVAYK